MTPDFAEWLLATFPEADRSGLVFRLIDQKTHLPITAPEVGRLVSRIGRKAGVVTNKAEGKNAGLHDLRRAFCTRWAKQVMPAILRRLARHSSITTTLAYYVDLDSDAVADELWAKHEARVPDRVAKPGDTPDSGNTSGNIDPEATPGVECRDRI